MEIKLENDFTVEWEKKFNYSIYILEMEQEEVQTHLADWYQCCHDTKILTSIPYAYSTYFNTDASTKYLKKNKWWNNKWHNTSKGP